MKEETLNKAVKLQNRIKELEKALLCVDNYPITRDCELVDNERSTSIVRLPDELIDDVLAAIQKSCKSKIAACKKEFEEL